VAHQVAVLDPVQRGVLVPEPVQQPGQPVALLRGLQVAWYDRPASMQDSTSSSLMRSRSAISAVVGERPKAVVRSSVALLTCTHSSCRRRGTWTVRTLSRKYRLISPTTVGIANVGNCTPRSGSKRSMALMRPMVPTWTTSSIGSLRERKRAAA
jgi:hypothetical protein